MQQLNFFPIETQTYIPGLKYIESYITKEEEYELLAKIDESPWLIDLKRRVQHYGYKYDYKSKKIDSNHYIGPIPQELKYLCDRLLDEGVFSILPDQIIVNEYLPGQGIAPHIDCIPCFDDVICSISLGSDCVMEFSKNKSRRSQLLEATSLLVLTSDARHGWKHSIAARKFDNYNGSKIARKRRVSLTFRKVKACQHT